MNELFAHIEFLLHTHDCVIVPNLGGFVLNRTAATRDGLSVFNAPQWELIFNSALTYNDGLLAESYMRINDISFAAACRKIDNAVEEIKKEIRKNSSLHIDNIGTLQIGNGGNISLTPQPFIRPEFYGLTTVSMQPTIQLQAHNKSSKKAATPSSNTARRIGIVAASAAAIAALILLIVPIKNNSGASQPSNVTAESGFISTKTQKPAAAKPITTASNPEQTVQDADLATTAPSNETSVENSIESNSNKRYEIVLGVYEVNEAADKMVESLKKDGITTINRFTYRNRINVSAGSFDDKTEAFEQLQKIKQNYPQYKNAWLLEKKKYEIVVGVYGVNEAAETQIEALKKDGFDTAHTFKHHGQFNVSAGGYTDRAVAYKKLQEIRKNFPDYKNAWLLKK